MDPVAEAVARLERVFDRAEPFDPRTSRRLFRIAATDNLEFYVLPHLVAILQRTAPGIDLRVSALPQDWMTALQRGDIDLKLVAPTAPLEAEMSGVVDVALAKQGLRRHIKAVVPHFLVAPIIVANSDLVLTAPARLLDSFVQALELRPLELPIKLAGYKLSMTWAARTREDEAHRWLRGNIPSALAASKGAPGQASTTSMDAMATIHDSGAPPSPRVRSPKGRRTK